MKKKKASDRTEWRTEKGIPLGENTPKFSINESKQAQEHANYKGSYVGRAMTEKGEFVGWYVPA